MAKNGEDGLSVIEANAVFGDLEVGEQFIPLTVVNELCRGSPIMEKVATGWACLVDARGTKGELPDRTPVLSIVRRSQRTTMPTMKPRKIK